MTDYSELHDQQINMMVCKALGLEMSGYARIMALDDATILLADNKTLVDYCNNPADAWPIIFENKIMLSPRCADDEWKAEIYLGREDIFDNYASAWHKNPLRAAMIVFLLMKGKK